MEEESRFSTKLFMGCILTPRMQMQISHASDDVAKECNMERIRHNGKEYIGRFIADDAVPLCRLPPSETGIRSDLELLYPGLILDCDLLHIFPVLFLQ